MDLRNLFNFKMWFNTDPGALLPGSIKILLVVFIVFIILMIAAQLISKSKKLSKIKAVIAQKISGALFWITLAFLIFFFFAQQGLPILGMRLWFFLIFIGGIIWFVFIIRYAVIEVPKKEKEKEERDRFQKYLPKKK